MSSSRKYNYWIPLADLMTVLMVIFLFMAISYMIVIKKKYVAKDKIIQDYHNTKKELISDIKHQFSDDFKKSQDIVLDSNDLSIKFNDKKILFDFDKSDLKDEFKTTLSDFLPRYLDIILQKKYADKIAEVRIEGHTSTEGDYIYNLKLSQDRTRNVMEYLLGLDYYKKLNDEDKRKLQYLLTANGLSFGRTLDKNGILTYTSNAQVDNERCRRVEFKIITKSDESLNKALSANN